VLREGEREREKKTWGVSERHYILGWEGDKFFPALKVPRQCPLVLLVEVRFREIEDLEVN
jgi:hypothetical protein